MSEALLNPLPRGYSAFAMSHPVLTCQESQEWEARVLHDDGEAWLAMRQAGKALARAILLEYRFGRYGGKRISAFALVGKGHNGGDALLGLLELAELGAIDTVVVAIAGRSSQLKPNTRKALELLEDCLDSNLLEQLIPDEDGFEQWSERIETCLSERHFDVGLDGLLGMQFQKPLRDSLRGAIEAWNEAPNIGVKIAVDIPSGIGDASDERPLVADVTLATGICKQATVDSENAAVVGKIRYLDIGFFDENPSSAMRVLNDRILSPLRRRRPSLSEKRCHGHLFILAGSRQMPGALLMAAQSAVQSGVGLVTVFAPESVVPSLVAKCPEAMWVSWPETPDGGLALEGEYLIRRMANSATALLMGPGMGREAETATLVQSIVSNWSAPILIDADALIPEVVAAATARNRNDVIATPHLGEYKRIGGVSDDDTHLRHFSTAKKLITVLKGANSRIATRDAVYVNTSGNAVLSRGGSGDVLSGVIASLLAQFPSRPAEAACMGVYWHGKAADVLAAHQGQVATRTAFLIDCLAEALESEGDIL